MGSNHLDIWRVSLDLLTDPVKLLKPFLSEGEANRAARFHFPVDNVRYIAAHGCLREILARYTHSDPDQLVFSANRYGKPALRDHMLEFNLSHSGDFALIAVTQAHKVGVDVECIRSDIELESMARRFFSPIEVSELMSLLADQRLVGFFNCWTRKEAYIKAHGLGLSLPLDSFDVSLTPGEPAILRATRPDAEEAARWTIIPLEVAPGYSAAVSFLGKDLDLRLWDWKLSRE